VTWTRHKCRRQSGEGGEAGNKLLFTTATSEEDMVIYNKTYAQQPFRTIYSFELEDDAKHAVVVGWVIVVVVVGVVVVVVVVVIVEIVVVVVVVVVGVICESTPRTVRSGPHTSKSKL
jgi:Flp pilus assembly protein TadB